jgi:SOS-response transcriptional repressor LexA
MNADDTDRDDNHRVPHSNRSARMYQPLRPLDPEAELTHEDAALVERERDLLVHLFGERSTAMGALSSPVTVRLLDWYARELRDTLTISDRARLTAGGIAFAEAFGRRQSLAATGVASINEAPASSRVPAAESIADLVSLGTKARHAPRADLAVAAGEGRELWEEPCSEWIALPDDVPSGRYLALTAHGKSMEPLLHSGDVFLLRLGSELERGTVVVGRHPDNGYVVKRVGTIGSLHVELTSLNPDFRPVRVPRDPSLVLGTVILRWCTHGTPASQ